LLQYEGLPFSETLTAEPIQQVFDAERVSFGGANETRTIASCSGAAFEDSRSETDEVDIVDNDYSHRVGNRPNRVEPRAVKRRPDQIVLLTELRSVARAKLIAGQKVWTARTIRLGLTISTPIRPKRNSPSVTNTPITEARLILNPTAPPSHRDLSSRMSRTTHPP